MAGCCQRGNEASGSIEGGEFKTNSDYLLLQKDSAPQNKSVMLGLETQWSPAILYECVSKSFRTGRLERELQMVQLSTTKCSCIATLSVSLVGFAAITLCVASQRVFIVVRVNSVIDSVRKLWIQPRT
jgi:hypothetical protein